MEEECKQAPPGYRTQMLSRVRGYKQDIDMLQKDLVCCNNFSLYTPHSFSRKTVSFMLENYNRAYCG